MRTRYTINADGDLESRDGSILGRVVGITIDLREPPSRVAVGGSGDLPSGAEQVSFLPAPAEEVWQTYVAVMEPRRSDLDFGTRKVINDALKIRSIAECKLAIVGCSASDWHMGRDPQTHGRSYKQVTNILKGKRGGRTTADQIDFFIDIARAAGVETAGDAAIDRDRMTRCKAAVMTAWEFPADDLAAAAGAEARLWLGEHGVIVDMAGKGEDLGRPSFRRAS